jgi:hypothetical protein
MVYGSLIVNNTTFEGWLYMAQNIIEYARQLSVTQLFKASGFKKSWQVWKAYINDCLISNPPISKEIYKLGDNLREIFRTTAQSGRSQSDIAGGGASWEALVCWYLNLCLIGRRTFVIKHHNSLIPEPIKNAITIYYGNFPSNTESDLIALSFPNKKEYEVDKDILLTMDEYRKLVSNNKKSFPLLPVLNNLSSRDFSEIEIHIIQCKTNWNDNAQIPMLWDAVYSASNFRNGITVGSEGYSIHDCSRFTYSFVTVPSNKMTNDTKATYKPTSTSVLRVKNLSGGNYWGNPTEKGVASSIKEMLERNLKNGHDSGLLNTIQLSIPLLSSQYDYFNLL